VRPRSALLWLVATTFFWGGSFAFNKIGFREFPPVLFMFLRFSLAAAIMTVVCARRLGRIDRTLVRKGVVVGLFLAAANLSFVLGVSGTTASRAGFLCNLFVLIVPILAFVLWRQPAGRGKPAAIGVAVLGLWLMARGGPEGFSRGDLLSTICSFFISFHLLAVSRLLGGSEDVRLVTLIQFVTVAAAGGILCAVARPAPGPRDPVSLAALAYCAVFPTVVCFTLQNAYQRYVTPMQASLIYTLDPVWSLLGGMALLGERMTPREWTGCLLILVAVAGSALIRPGPRPRPLPEKPEGDEEPARIGE
jgi:drug/metabolite transporter (DMT)-like permease